MAATLGWEFLEIWRWNLDKLGFAERRNLSGGKAPERETTLQSSSFLQGN